MNLDEKGLVITLVFLILTLGNVYLHENKTETETVIITRTVIIPTNDSKWHPSGLVGGYNICFDSFCDKHSDFYYNVNNSFFKVEKSVIRYGRLNGYGWKTGYCIIFYKDPVLEQELYEQCIANGITDMFDWGTGSCISGGCPPLESYYMIDIFCLKEGYYDHKIQEQVTTWFFR